MNKQIKLGDAIAKLTKTLGIPHCPKCEQRRLILNEIKKLGLKETAKRMMAVNRSTVTEENRALKDVVAKLTDCCKDDPTANRIK